MTAEPVPLIPQDDGNFASDETTTVVFGACRCPGRPHAEDTAEVRVELPWATLVDVGTLSGAAAYRALVLGGLVSWNLLDLSGEAVPIDASTVGRLRSDRLEALAGAVNASFERARSPLPNDSGAPSRPSRRESASPNPTIRPRARHTKSR